MHTNLQHRLDKTVLHQKKIATKPIQNIAASCSSWVIVLAAFKVHQFKSFIQHAAPIFTYLVLQCLLHRLE